MNYTQRKKRYDEVVRLREGGMTLESIGEKFNISRERARQILLAPPKHSLQRFCELCAKPFNSESLSRKYCFSCSERIEKKQGRDRTREIVRIRDKDRCTHCGKKWQPDTRKFDVHHLNGFCGKKSRSYDSQLEIIGLTTLCHKCHIGQHVLKTQFSRRPRMTADRKKAIFILKDTFSQDKIAEIMNTTQTVISAVLLGKRHVDL